MGENLLVGAACLFQGIRQDGEAGGVKSPNREEAFIVHGLCQPHDHTFVPG